MILPLPCPTVCISLVVRVLEHSKRPPNTLLLCESEVGMCFPSLHSIHLDVSFRTLTKHPLLWFSYLTSPFCFDFYLWQSLISLLTLLFLGSRIIFSVKWQSVLIKKWQIQSAYFQEMADFDIVNKVGNKWTNPLSVAWDLYWGWKL